MTNCFNVTRADYLHNIHIVVDGKNLLYKSFVVPMLIIGYNINRYHLIIKTINVIRVFINAGYVINAVIPLNRYFFYHTFIFFRIVFLRNFYVFSRQYQERVRTVAKAFIKLGLERYHSVCILGFNSEQWFVADLAAIHAGLVYYIFMWHIVITNSFKQELKLAWY